MKIKTSELTDAALDWAIGTAIGGLYQPVSVRDAFWIWPGEPVKYSKATPAYSTDWAQGGPIIGRIKGLQLKNWLESKPETCCEVHIHNYEGNWIQFGPTPLIAAMRCYVASKLGDEVDVPEELVC